MTRTGSELSALERLVVEGTDADILRLFILLRPPELADLVESIPEGHRLRVLRLMNAPLRSDVISEVEESERGEIMEDLSSAEIAEIVPHMMSDDAADVIGALPPEKAERTLGRLEDEDREEIRELLEYDEETAGGIMQSELVTVPDNLTVAQAIEAVRKADASDVGEIHEVFVVDADGRLVGSVSPADLLHAPGRASVRKVAEPNPVVVPVTMDQEMLARKAREHDLATIPVVDENGVLVGQVLHDDIADVLAEEATEDIARLAGADPDELYEDRVWLAVRRRAVWLLPAFGGGLMVSVVIGLAEEDLGRAPMLLVFLPVVLGMAGNIGTQTSALTVRGLALGRIEWSRAGRVIARQFQTGLVLGLFFGVLLFCFALIKGSGHAELAKYAVTVSFAIVGSMTVGTTMGVTVPILLHRMGLDPAVSSSPFIQTTNDLTGAGILLLIAYWIGLL